MIGAVGRSVHQRADGSEGLGWLVWPCQQDRVGFPVEDSRREKEPIIEPNPQFRLGSDVGRQRVIRAGNGAFGGLGKNQARDYQSEEDEEVDARMK